MDFRDLSTSQQSWLIRLDAERSGIAAPFGNSSLVALKDRSLVELRGTRALSRIHRWHITQAGADLLAADRGRRRDAA